METCNFEIVHKHFESEDKCSSKDNNKDVTTIPHKYLLRQILVCSGIWSSYFCYGLSFGAPTVLIPQLRQEANSSDAVSVEMASWLSSTLNYSGIASAIILAILAKLIGRKLSFLITCITAIISYVTLYYSTTATQILISEILNGPLIACPITISIMVLTEYVSPCYRGVFLTIKSATFIWGIWIANAIGTFFHWKNIAILAFICSTYSLLTTLLWPESPYWLANKNRLEDCAKSYMWLRGSSNESEAELEVIMQSRKLIHDEKFSLMKFLMIIVKMFKSKSFIKPILLSMSLMALYQFSGKVVCGMYSIDIITRITGSQSAAYTGMLVLDGITVLGMYVGCGFSKVIKRRSYLIVSSTIGVTFLFCISFYLHLIHYKLISEDIITSMCLLTAYSLTISIGPMIMSTTILSELVPLKYRSTTLLLLGCFGNLLMGSILKVSPFLINYLGVRGIFLIFAIIESLFIFINSKVLPETKDKTILEIQENLLGRELKTLSINTRECRQRDAMITIRT